MKRVSVIILFLLTIIKAQSVSAVREPVKKSTIVEQATARRKKTATEERDQQRQDTLVDSRGKKSSLSNAALEKKYASRMQGPSVKIIDLDKTVD